MANILEVIILKKGKVMKMKKVINNNDAFVQLYVNETSYSYKFGYVLGDYFYHKTHK